MQQIPHTNELWDSAQGATQAPCDQFSHPTHALTCSSGLFCHPKVVHYPGSNTLPCASFCVDNQPIHTTWSPVAHAKRLSSHNDALSTWLGFETTNWLDPMWKHSSSHSALKSGSGKPSYEDVFLMLFVLTCHARPHPSGLLELQRFWYLVQICHSVRTLPSPSLALMPMCLPSLCSTVSDTLCHTWMHRWPLYPTWALAFWSADYGPPTQWLLDWSA